jgi:hypothetical protein
MRRAALGTGMAVVVVAALGGAAQGGPPTIDERGNFEMIDMEVSPPITSTRARPQPVTLRYQGFAGNRMGQPARPERSAILRFPRGMRFNSAFFARCPLPASSEELGDDRCSRASRVGRGTAEIQVGSAYFPAEVTLFNGARRDGRPTLIFRGITDVGGTEARSEFNFEIRGAQTRPRLVSLPVPEGAAPPEFALSQIDVRLGRTTTRGGVRRGYVEAPRRCTGHWHFSLTTGYADGTALTSRDATPCARAAQPVPAFAGAVR